MTTVVRMTGLGRSTIYWLIAKLAYRYGVDAFMLIMYRMLMALPLFLLLAWWSGRGKPGLNRRDWHAILGLGFCGYYLASTLDFAGLQYVSAGLGRLVLHLDPTLVLLLSWCLLGRRVAPAQAVAMAVSYCGVLLVFGQELKVQGPDTALGAAPVFGSALSYALYLLYSGEQVKRLGALRLTGPTRQPRLASRNVTINNLLPGVFDTDRILATLKGMAAKTGKTIEEFKEARRATIPACRYGTPQEFGQICAFICGAQASYLTGQNILLDGGAYPGTS